MAKEFAREVLLRLPLAEATLALWQWATQPQFLDGLFDRFRRGCYERVITFSVLVQLIGDALLQHGGSGRKSFERHREEGLLTVSAAAAYQKLGRLPVAVSENFLAETTARLRHVVPSQPQVVLAESLQSFRPIILDGKAVKQVPKRLKPLRGGKRGVLGGKALVALDLQYGLAIAMATHPDGETNDAKLVPQLVPEVRRLTAGAVILWIADRQFCDLQQTAEFVDEGHHFLVRYCKKTGFHPDPERPSRTGVDDFGRPYTEEWGYLGRASHKQRRYVRRITLRRTGEEDIVLVTDLLDENKYPAKDLLAAYLQRWGIERVFQQITEVFALKQLIGTTPEGTLFQLAFCLLLYNLIQVVRGYIAEAQQRKPETISTELLFDDVRRQLIALYEMVGVACAERLFVAVPTAEMVRTRMRQLLSTVWTDRWIKATSRKRRPKQTSGQRNHTSVYRMINAYRQSQRKNTDEHSG
jgi:Transposase DDE domain